MPGYIIHLCEAQIILDKLKKEKTIDQSYITDFSLGAVLPDATLDKELTHFRPQWQRPLITKYPDLSYVMSQYEKKLNTPADFGILSHYLLDTEYVLTFWPKFINLENPSGEKSAAFTDENFVRILKEDQLIPMKEFFSGSYFYGDYDILNPLFEKHYHPFVPTPDHIPKTNILECEKTDITKLQQDMDQFVFHKKGSVFTTPKAFPFKAFCSFLEETADLFISRFSYLM